jgi:hypothetical protein
MEARRDLFELQEVRLPHGGIPVNAFEMRFVLAPRIFDLRRPTRAPMWSCWRMSTNAFQFSPDRGGAGIPESADNGSA